MIWRNVIWEHIIFSSNACRENYGSNSELKIKMVELKWQELGLLKNHGKEHGE